jgi:hypothetical protein
VRLGWWGCKKWAKLWNPDQTAVTPASAVFSSSPTFIIFLANINICHCIVVLAVLLVDVVYVVC